MTRNPDRPSQSFSHDFPWDDPTAHDRLDRMAALFPGIYRSGRYERVRSLYYYQEHVYGLPRIQVEIDSDCNLKGHGDSLLKQIGHLPRIDLHLTTARLADWLAHPLLARVDKLHVWPSVPPDCQLDEYSTKAPHYDAFWDTNIPILVDSPVIDRLEELNPCGCLSTARITERSAQNLAICKEFLEPRVRVEYSY
jgi:hypothetical protein